MDDRFRQRILELARQLAVEEKERLARARTFVEIEDLVTEIGDELTRQLAQHVLGQRGEDMLGMGSHACPDCGKACEVEDEPEPIILQGRRAEIEYQEPRCFCTRCRRAFFPSGGGTPAAASRVGHAERDAKSGLGGDASTQF